MHTGGGDGIELTIVTMTFDTSDPERLSGLLATYVLVTRAQPGCRNVDLATSVTRPERFFVIQKWGTPEAQQAHFDSEAMVAMAEGCRGLLTRPPEIDLLEPISAHDLA
jgi:quinol monooxygenase YgiN